MPDSKKYILNMTCPDTLGISASISNFIYEKEGFITSSFHYGDDSTKMFFMRTEFEVANSKGDTIEKIKSDFQPIAKKFSMQWSVEDCNIRPRVLIAVSKFGHCLNDLLHKTQSGQIPMEIAGVMSNHKEMESLVSWHGLDYFHLPVTRETKKEQEKKFLDLVEELNVDLVVLARYMQILSPELCIALQGRCINIHHSFLPSFKGAKPYSQAHDRGVKIVGATAHYVTPSLDEGPIIEQSVERINHTYSSEEIANTVKDLETVVLSRAVKWHVERRILLNNNKTVVFK